MSVALATDETKEELLTLLRAGETIEFIRCISGSKEREILLTMFQMTEYREEQQFTHEMEPCDWVEGTSETSKMIELATNEIVEEESFSGFYIDGLVSFEA